MTVLSTLDQVKAILNQVIPILMILATVIFLWGIITYITAGGDEEKIKSGRRFIVFGLVGLFLMVSVWGIVGVLMNTFDLNGAGIPSYPGGIGIPPTTTP
ncbi:hypothetical protein HYT01_02415 [Candidatus Giovannonibacteria bacterium]|nr:hypothetical protein [Candidatus Giovannonibacteria bacterium]